MKIKLLLVLLLSNLLNASIFPVNIEHKINPIKIDNLQNFEEEITKDINTYINTKYNCFELFKKMEILKQVKRPLISIKNFSIQDVHFYGIFSIQFLYIDNNECKVRLNFGINHTNNKVLPILDENNKYPDLETTKELLKIYIDNKIETTKSDDENVKDIFNYDFVTMYNIYNTLKDDIEIKDFFTKNFSDAILTDEKDFLLKNLINKNYYKQLEKEKQIKMTNFKKTTKNKEIINEYEKKLTKENADLISSNKFPFWY